MRTVEFTGVVTALSSIYHGGGQSIGVNSKLRREKFVQPDGSVEEVPLISGNAIRGVLRDRGMLHMCRALGYGEPDESNKPAGLSLPAFYFLFSGGSLTKTADRGIDIDRARELRRLIPLVSVFGGAMGNQIMPGKLKIDKMIPICAETVHLLPEQYREENVLSIWEYLQEEMYTRKDDEKDENKRLLIDSQVRALLEAEARSKREAKSQPAIQTDTGQNQQMMYFVETFAAGVRFYWSIVLDDVTDVEFDAFGVALAEFARMPYVGSKSNVGLGKVAIKLNNWHTIDSRIVTNSTEVDVPLGKHYQQHLQAEGERIKRTLAEIA